MASGLFCAFGDVGLGQTASRGDKAMLADEYRPDTYFGNLNVSASTLERCSTSVATRQSLCKHSSALAAPSVDRLG